MENIGRILRPVKAEKKRMAAKALAETNPGRQQAGYAYMPSPPVWRPHAKAPLPEHAPEGRIAEVEIRYAAKPPKQLLAHLLKLHPDSLNRYFGEAMPPKGKIINKPGSSYRNKKGAK